VIRKLRALFRSVLLRGPLLRWWTTLRAVQWERAYCDELVKSSKLPSEAQRPSRPIPTAVSLRTIVFIADCMWEQDDLIPELGKIAQVELINLRPNLKAKSAGQTNAEVVASAVKAFVGSHPDLTPDVILFYARPALLSNEAFDCLRQKWSCALMGMNLDDKLEFFPYGVFQGGIDNYQN